MRTYAVWSKSAIVLVGLGAIGVTCVILDCVSNAFPNPDPNYYPDGYIYSCMFRALDATVLRQINCASLPFFIIPPHLLISAAYNIVVRSIGVSTTSKILT